MKIAIVNYGMGNLASVRRAFEDLRADAFIANSPAQLDDAHKVVLPGVGAFGDGMRNLHDKGWVEKIRETVREGRKPLLGICLGMQMLATRSFEGGENAGLDLIPGDVCRLDKLGCSLRVPHVGWNEVTYQAPSDILDGIPVGTDFYFVHSFAMVPQDSSHLIGSAAYDCEVAAVVRNGNVFGCQFHPEKSSRAGRQILKNFISFVAC